MSRRDRPGGLTGRRNKERCTGETKASPVLLHTRRWPYDSANLASQVGVLRTSALPRISPTRTPYAWMLVLHGAQGHARGRDQATLALRTAQTSSGWAGRRADRAFAPGRS